MQFERMPSLPRLYLRGALRGQRETPRGEFEPRIPKLSAGIANVEVDANLLDRYRRVCAFSESDHLPATFLHVLATPLHASMVMSAAFPYPVLGLVHARQRIVQHAPIASDAALALECRIDAEREARRGVEFDTVTQARVRGELVWEGTSTALVRTRGPGDRGRPRPPESGPVSSRRHRFEVPADMGRRYAAVTRDYNPIHLYGLTARPFGFARPIVHGMWSVARCLAALERELPAHLNMKVSFRRPVFLPSTVVFDWERTDIGLAFALRTRGRVNLLGTVGK